MSTLPHTWRLEPAHAQFLPLLLAAVVQHRRQRGAEALKLGDPVGQRRERADDEEGAIDALGLEVRKEANGLDLRGERKAQGSAKFGKRS